jgi:hypothetical protein
VWTYVVGDRTTPAAGGVVALIALPLAAALVGIAAPGATRRLRDSGAPRG